MSDESMRDRVARAIRVSIAAITEGTHFEHVLEPYAPDLADAALRALREPTGAMLAAVRPPHEGVGGLWREYAANDWRAMIDAALGDG